MKYEVEITRISYSTQTFGIEADNEEEARQLAMSRAHNTVFSEDDAEYEINGCYELEAGE